MSTWRSSDGTLMPRILPQVLPDLLIQVAGGEKHLQTINQGGNKLHVFLHAGKNTWKTRGLRKTEAPWWLAAAWLAVCLRVGRWDKLLSLMFGQNL